MSSTFCHTTIATEYHALYSADFWTRFNAHEAESERQMRECMGNRDNYDIEGVRSVVAYHEKNMPGCRRAAVARAVLAERLAELQPVKLDPAFATLDDAPAIQAAELRHAQTMQLRSLLEMRADFSARGKRVLLEKTTAVIDTHTGNLAHGLAWGFALVVPMWAGIAGAVSLALGAWS